MRPDAVHVDAPLYAAAVAGATRAWPREFAAIVGGQWSAARAIVRAIEPLASTGNEREFAVDAAVFASAEADLRARGLQWLGFLHSHPGGTAALSLRDRRELWRGCVQIVVAVTAAGAAITKAWRLEGDRELPLAFHVGHEEPPR